MRNTLKTRHPLIQIVCFLLIALISMLFTTLFSSFLGFMIWGVGFMNSLSGTMGENFALHLSFFQIFSHLGMFIIPAIVFAWIINGNILQYYTLNRGATFYVLGLGIVLIFSIQPLINVLGELNMNLKLPDSLRSWEVWMKNSEDKAKMLTDEFTKTNTINGLILNIAMIVLIPAIGEELVFRGIVQKCIQNWLKSGWTAIIITSVIFSAFHLQFYGFLPRLALGLLLGYVFYATGRLWVSILLHFINNGVATVAYWLYARGNHNFDPEHIANYNDNYLALTFSILLFVGALYLFNKNIDRKKHEKEESV